MSHLNNPCRCDPDADATPDEILAMARNRCRWAGEDAYEDGYSPSFNPHVYGTDQHTWWLEGWAAARDAKHNP